MGKRAVKKKSNVKSVSRLIGELQTERAEARSQVAYFQQAVNVHQDHVDKLTRQIEDIAVGVAGERDRLCGV